MVSTSSFTPKPEEGGGNEVRRPEKSLIQREEHDRNTICLYYCLYTQAVQKQSL